MSTSSRNEILLSTFESQYLVGAASPCGHSISNVSSGRSAAALIGAVRTRARAKRERSGSAEPCIDRPSEAIAPDNRQDPDNAAMPLQAILEVAEPKSTLLSLYDANLWGINQIFD
jgi:hypothetical protein